MASLARRFKWNIVRKCIYNLHARSSMPATCSDSQNNSLFFRLMAEGTIRLTVQLKRPTSVVCWPNGSHRSAHLCALSPATSTLRYATRCCRHSLQCSQRQVKCKMSTKTRTWNTCAPCNKVNWCVVRRLASCWDRATLTYQLSTQ